MKTTNAIEKALEKKAVTELNVILEKYITELKGIEEKYGCTYSCYFKKGDTKLWISDYNDWKSVLMSAMQEKFLNLMVTYKSKELIEKLEM